MPNFWLLKTEPSAYSYSNLEKDGKTMWDGVTNNYALKNMSQIKKGDVVFIYHTGDEKQVVGIAKTISDPYPDPKQKTPRLLVIDLEPYKKLAKPVTLYELKAKKELKSFELVRLPRLSVMPVAKGIWEIILKMAGEK